MSSEAIAALGVAELGRLLRARELTSTEVVRSTLARARDLNRVLNAFILFLDESALAAAAVADEELRAGIDRGPLHGVPVSVKDIIDVRGTRTTAASPMTADDPAKTNDAAVVVRLREAGAIVVGKNNLHEFAAGVPDEDGPFGWVRNPRNLACQPGSSSSGSAAAVASGLSALSYGTDTAQSVRVPAALCGVVGIKPTYGRVPLAGVVPLSPRLDHVGVLGRSVADAAFGLAAILDRRSGAGPDAVNTAAERGREVGEPVNGLRIGIPAGEFFSEVQEPVRAAFADAIEALRSEGCAVSEITLRGVEETPELTQLVLQAEAAAYHARYAGREDAYGASFRALMIPGRAISAVQYLTALERMAALTAEWSLMFDRVDLLLTPTSPVLAPPRGADEVDVRGTPRPFRTFVSRFTRPFSMAGFPALAMPSGIGPAGLPASVQLIAAPFQEHLLCRVGHRLERALGLPVTIEPRGSLAR